MCTVARRLPRFVVPSVYIGVLLLGDDGGQGEPHGHVVNGYTALHWAVENGDLDMVCLLLDHEADPNITASFDKHSGVTALHLASQVNIHIPYYTLLVR